jgi:Xaa-Pro aminopeptidase
VIRSAGFGEFFPSRTGHGVGLQVDEAPDIAAGSRTELRAGMVMSVEPAIYVPGHGGVRLEDVVVISPGGPVRVLTRPQWALELQP